LKLVCVTAHDEGEAVPAIQEEAATMLQECTNNL